MRYLAIPEMPRRSLWASLRHWGHWKAEWHAVADSPIKPIETLCGVPYTAEAHRTWDQTLSDARCPQCQRLVTGADWVTGATSLAEGATSTPDNTQPLEPASRRVLDAFLAQRIGQARRLHPASDPGVEVDRFLQ